MHCSIYIGIFGIKIIPPFLTQNCSGWWFFTNPQLETYAKIKVDHLYTQGSAWKMNNKIKLTTTYSEFSAIFFGRLPFLKGLWKTHGVSLMIFMPLQPGGVLETTHRFPEKSLPRLQVLRVHLRGLLGNEAERFQWVDENMAKAKNIMIT